MSKCLAAFVADFVTNIYCRIICFIMQNIRLLSTDCVLPSTLRR